VVVFTVSAVGSSRVPARIARGALAAAVPGVVSAAVTRLLMRAVAVALRLPTGFSLGASFGIAVFYAIALAPGCLALALTRRRWPWVIFAGGVGLLLFGAVNIALDETRSAYDLTTGRWALAIVLLTAMAVVYALHFWWAARWARHRAGAVRPG
jgi:hypothetical protein